MRSTIAIAALLLALGGCSRRGDDASWAADVDGVRIPAADLQRQVDQRMEGRPRRQARGRRQ